MMNKTSQMAAVTTARILWLPMLVRLTAFACATASVVGVVAFFAFESIYPYRWYLLVGGALGSGVLGWIGDRITPTREMIAEAKEQLIRDGMIDADRKDQNNAG